MASSSLSHPSGEDEDANIDAAAIVAAIYHKLDVQRRMAAKQKLQELGPKAIGPLMKLIRRESRQRERRNRLIAGFALICTGGALLGLLFGSTGNPTGFIGWYFIALVLLLSLFFATRPTLMQMRAVHVLAGFDDARIIGPLAEALQLEDVYTERVAAASLKRILPRVRATEAALIDNDHRTFLYHALQSDDSDLVIAVLAALEQIGDSNALPFVEKLSERPVRTASDLQLRNAASQSIPAILASAARHDVGSTLLRPTVEPAKPEKSLLRPVADARAADSDLLVRPAASIPE